MARHILVDIRLLHLDVGLRALVRICPVDAAGERRVGVITPNQLVVLGSKSRKLARVAMPLGERRYGSIVATDPVQRLFLQGARSLLAHPLRADLLNVSHVGTVTGLLLG